MAWPGQSCLLPPPANGIMVPVCRRRLGYFVHRTIRYENKMDMRKGKGMRAMGTAKGLSAERLQEMAAVDVRTVDISTLTDLRDIKINTKDPVGKKLASFAAQTDNLYVNRIGDYVVKVRYQKEGPTIDEKMEEYVRRLSESYV